MLRAALGLLLLASATAKYQVIYAGFDHVLVVDTNGNTVSAFDTRRHLSMQSTCNLFANPPLVSQAPLRDWLSKQNQDSPEDLTYTFLGYENFLVEDKTSGDFVLRRCRDFRPQLEVLPCEPYATGKGDVGAFKFQNPYKTVFLGGNRVMLLNTQMATYSVHPFDADVHTGGDPFKFASGPLFEGTFPQPVRDDSEFAYVQLPDHQGDILLVGNTNDDIIKGYRFNGRAKNEKDFNLNPALLDHAPVGFHMTGLGEGQVLVYDSNLVYKRIGFFKNESGIYSQHGNFGSLRNAPSECLYDNATSCVKDIACAWCPSSYTCHPYDRTGDLFCDAAACEAPPLMDAIAAGQAVVVPDCVQDTQTQHDAIFDLVDEGYNSLPSDARLHTDYRKNAGDFSSTDASPIHPAFDNELGDDPVIVSENYNDQVVHEENRVGSGEVYRPPAPSESAPCMDSNTSAFKSVEVQLASTSVREMNMEVLDNQQPLDIPKSSPVGDTTTAVERPCARNQTQARYRDVSQDQYVPRSGVPTPASEDYMPSSQSTKFEEDLMNEDKTPHANLNAQWIHPAIPTDPTLSQKYVDSESLFYHPREPGSQERPGGGSITQPVLRSAQESHTPDLMNAGLETAGLANVDCTDTGGKDAQTTLTQVSAMQNSVKPEFPETLEDQLNLFKDEPHKIVDYMPAPQPENQLHHHFPADKNQTYDLPTTSETPDTVRIDTHELPNVLVP